MSRPIATDRCIDVLKYIIIAFNTEARRYNRVFLSSLTGKERGEGNVTFNFDLDDLDHNNFQSTHFYRQEPAVDWINTVPGKTVCTHIAFENPDAVKEAKRRNLTNRDCQQSQVSDKGRIRDLPVFPGQVSYAAIKKPIEVQVFAQDFFRLKPVQKNRDSGKGRKLKRPALPDNWPDLNWVADPNLNWKADPDLNWMADPAFNPDLYILDDRCWVCDQIHF